MNSVEITDADFDAFSLPGIRLEEQETTIPEREAWLVNKAFTLEDKNGKNKTKFTLFNERYLSLAKESKKADEKEAIIDLAFLDEQMIEQKQFPKVVFATSLVSFLSVFISYFVFPFYYILPSAFALLALALIVVGFRSFKYTVRFNTMIGDIPVLDLSLDQSNKDRAVKFFLQIKDHVNRSRKRLPEGKRLTPMLVSEMRRLSEVGLISSQQYDRIKSQIFSTNRA